ncbi:MAG: hypothetical protein M1830_001137 [Pleopsidium flavum]|nr:MAG: hypothetical protein M1830_001137 [Pleopsidium flavum]
MSKEDEFAYAAQALPTPTDTPYRTPRSLSRRSSRRCSPSPGPSSSPSPFLPGVDSYFRGHGESKDVVNDEKISILDPRRFTPTLHASLVSEILSLRRDLEFKTSLIENLESNLHAAKIENDTIEESLTSNAKEIRSLKRQVQVLEGGSLSAVDELAKERDEALASLSDIKQRLEGSQKKVRSQEEDAERTHALWDRDQESWEGERRNLEWKVHVVEGRLKTVLAEITAAQANNHNQEADMDAEEAVEDGLFGRESNRTSFHSNSVLGKRPMSSISNSTYDGDAHNVRFSMLSGPNGYHGAKLNGISLAEELAFNEEEEDTLEDSDLEGGQTSPDALPEERRERLTSLIVSREDQKARKVLGLPIEAVQGLVTANVSAPSTTEKMLTLDSSEKVAAVLKFQYSDTGVQYSPPPSPRLYAQSAQIVADGCNADRVSSPTENGANQSRKRVSISPVTPVEQIKVAPLTQLSTSMVSSASQTIREIDNPSSPPCTPNEALNLSHDLPTGVQTSSASTQTETHHEQQISPKLNISNAPTLMPVPIPTITIHPPLSTPSSPRNSVVLPPHTKSAACQASVLSSVKLRSISVQTEGIRIDNRAIKLPAKLLPSAISSQSPTPQLSDKEDDLPVQISSDTVVQGARLDLRSAPPVRPPPERPEHFSVESEEAYPGNNDNGPLDRGKASKIRRPFRSSSLFAGFDLAANEDPGDCGETELSDDDFRNAAPIRKTLSKVHNAWQLVPQPHRHDFEDSEIPEVDEEDEEKQDFQSIARKNMPQACSRRRSSAEREPNTTSSDMAPKWSNSMKQPDIRKKALISSGAAAHLQNSRSPNLQTTSTIAATVAAPPFPVPTRSSSRKIPLSASDGAQSPTPDSGGMFPSTRRREPARPPTKKAIVRKVRSAAASPRVERRRREDSQSTPPMSASSAAPDSPHFPPLPMDDISSPHYGHVGQLYKHDQRPSTSTSDAANTARDGSIPQTSVVDAIAQTMVGEWMWKYVRKRKSFGVSETPQADWDVSKGAADGSANLTGTGTRHKRWVWLAPYERAVMWSSKQPTSGSALLGKSGRKLMIQSVLDVRDDTPSPKGSTPQQTFSRSILILTPQRALKFTAISKERHYVWLSALSFLSHSTLGVHDLGPRPPIPEQEYGLPPRQNAATLRRNPIRDSIRVAKGKARPNINATRAYTSPVGGIRPEPTQRTNLHYGPDEEIPDAAEPPLVPRFSNHARKRSNTGPRQSVGSFRSLANHAAFASNHSLNTVTSGETHPPTSFGSIGHGSGRSSLSPRTSEASGPSGIVVNNFFDAVGTVRMEAFVERPRGYTEEQNQRPTRKSYRTREGRKKDMSYWGVNNGGHALPVEEGGEVPFRSDDPFRGF